MAMLTKRSHDAIDVLAATTTAAGAISLTYGDPVRLPGMVNAMVFTLGVTAAKTDSADTLDVKVQTKLDGTNWVDVVYFTQVLGNGGALQHIAKIEANTAVTMFANAALTAGTTRNLLGDEWRVGYAQADADSDGSFTFSVTACPM